MTTIDTLVITIIAIISLPSLCKSVNRPSLLYCAYLFVGIALAEFLEVNTRHMLEEAGKIGFVLLLFLIGLEIEIPGWIVVKKSIPFFCAWMGIQIPMLTIASWSFGFGWDVGFIGAAGMALR